MNILDQLRGGLIVSCQAAPGSPMDRPDILAAFARCAVEGGAAGIRANHGPNIAAIRAAMEVPLIGLKKRDVDGFEVYITPEWRDVLEVHEAGAEIIALDATARPRPGPEDFAALTLRIHAELGRLVMADVATFEEGLAAAEAGADIVGTTMSGYTADTADRQGGPDLDLVRRLAGALPDTPIIAEGRIHTPAHVSAALEAGAFAVVVGTAITAPTWITSRFVEGLNHPLR
jgi:N-acylglucosamine-6-phosphate 2-epimerase